MGEAADVFTVVALAVLSTAITNYMRRRNREKFDRDIQKPPCKQLLPGILPTFTITATGASQPRVMGRRNNQLCRTVGAGARYEYVTGWCSWYRSCRWVASPKSQKHWCLTSLQSRTLNLQAMVRSRRCVPGLIYRRAKGRFV